MNEEKDQSEQEKPQAPAEPPLAESGRPEPPPIFRLEQLGKAGQSELKKLEEFREDNGP